ncbi:hypothetical protein SNOG_11574 [Parastagonospora nodorum SN15]|uniref:AAA+ ATPase domain-containing protein n=1 Tax=Phaeosphaeria nodorum (strain SN15 / ATCC MYA-4574 / FGSC 10173) TaxID=321614 RepID=Q0U9J0_PHANO|nr:hypothetical protein SNOG_11574 [Parastagonospora nodorum SN15]EAT81282.2 hypothetical protein SNOG_11574 [Parastagonospora nodorum SN15]
MADEEVAAKRAIGLTKLFNAVIFGHRDLKSAANANRFLEALCAQEDVSKCVEQLIAAPKALGAVGAAFRFSANTAFLNGPATSTLHHLAHPSVKQLYAGQFLHRVLEQIVEPPTFWNTYVEAHNARVLTHDGTHAFAWLLLELLHGRSDSVPDVRDIAHRVTSNESLINSESLEVRNLGHKIKHVLQSTSTDAVDGPGGRHDNDFADYRQVKILPTPDEFASRETPFYRRSNDVQAVEAGSRGLVHLDNQFRLLREDLLGELRSDFQIATGQKKGRRKTVLEDLRFLGIECGPDNKRKPCSLKLECASDIPQLRNIKGAIARKKYISENRNMLKHQSLGCLISNSSIVGFATVERDEDLLAREPSVVVLRTADASSFAKVLMACKTGQDLNFVQVDTAVFAYEPILKCLRSMSELPLKEQVLNLTPGAGEVLSGIQPNNIINTIRDAWEADLRDHIGTTGPVKLDLAQVEALLTGLAKRLSLIQGPPGTGKSFIGALIAKILHDHTDERILVLSFTNHALDQMIIDIQAAGIPSDSVVRLGGKFSSSTQALSMSAQPNDYKMSRETYTMIQDQKAQAEAYHAALSDKLSRYTRLGLNEHTLLEHLEFSDDSEYFDALVVPEQKGEMKLVGKKNKRIERSYLIKRWLKGDDAGIFNASALSSFAEIWTTDHNTRLAMRNKWIRELIEEQVAGISTLAAKYDDCCNRTQQLFHMKDSHVISNKRIVACTTTAAAKYTQDIQKASPGIILVEEAGEILESHILTALTPATKQLILIGDHKQLRPKVNNYALSVEKGEGYDLNVSLFERLVLAGVPHTTLSKQHRMRPEISALVRALTYPELQDADSAQGRPDLRGFQDNVLFVTHSKPELSATRIADRRDEGAKTSKENSYEADMVLKCVRYLGQQGYGTDDIVILTPYLGQLSLLLKTLSADNDPILNDLDSHELIRAGIQIEQHYSPRKSNSIQSALMGAVPNHAGATCQKCEAEARALERRRQRDHKLDQERQANQKAYAARLAEIEDEIEHQKRLLGDRAAEEERQKALAQKKQDLTNLQKKIKAPVKVSKHPEPATPPDSAADRASNVSGDSPASHQSSSGSLDQTQSASDGTARQQDSDYPERDKSEAKDDWEEQKTLWGADNEALDSLMSMIGLESVKEQFLATKSKVDTLIRQNVSLKGERLGAALLGNPGTGKTTIARLYAKFLVKVGALPGDRFFESSGSSLANDGVTTCKAHIDKILEAGGGVFFIDEAYQLVSGNSFGGKAVLDYLLAEMENLTGKVVFVLAGYHKQMEVFFSHNPGIPSRIPVIMEFQDYNDKELEHILVHYINAKYKSNMKVEGGMKGLYVRIVARRIGRGRGRDGFGNARSVQNKVSQITERQSKRLRKERKAGLMPDDNLLTKEDLIGPEPSTILKSNTSWLRLQKLIGLASVKQSVQALLDGLQFNYQRELQEKTLVQYSLNRCFIGSPGTGKTSVAKLYGRILADIGLLSNGEVVMKSPADFIGSVLGGSEANTKGILASSAGKVLIIDEAYMLASGAAGDPYKVAVIDTIVAEVQSTPGEDRCVLLLGYKDQMEEMFRDVNPGLARRFPLGSAFVFEDFDDEEIRRILDLKLKDVGFNATDQAKNVAMDVIRRARNRPNFGNAGEVDIVLDGAKAMHQKHMTAGKVKDFDTFEAIDFDPDYDRGDRAATNLPALFQDVVGCEDLIKQFQGYQTTAANMKALGMDPREQLPFNFLFKGPPAQKMGKVFYDMGLLSQAKVVDCSATDLIGQYVGHTGPKVQKLLEKAMGKVLFIDEAYRLAEGGFATEAMDELVDCLTKPKFAHKLITILAGYDKDIDRLMTINPGLTSRFPESVIFKHLDPEISLELLTKDLRNLQKRKKAPLDLSVLEFPSVQLQNRVIGLFDMLSRLDSWGNARDVKSLAKKMFGALISKASQPVSKLVLTEVIILDTMESVLEERSRRNEAVGTNRRTMQPVPPQQHSSKIEQREEHVAIQKVDTIETTEIPLESIFKAKRDAGVSDAIWEQLELDKHAMVAREREYRRLQEEKRREEKRIEALKHAEKEAANEEERRMREQERVAAELERRRKEAILAAIEEAREMEKRRQMRLRQLGSCPAGFHWIKQSGGYRCAGGSHFLDDVALSV